MEIKDYYQILELPPSASLPEIKKSYRKLAQVHHPDKNNGDVYASAKFNEIKEAYEVLTNPSKKERYLQQRWYQQSMGKKKSGELLTPVVLLKQFLRLDKYVSTLDVHRMDKPGLYAYINELLTEETIAQLNAFDEPAMNRQIILLTLKCSEALPFSLMKPLQTQLQKINRDADTSQKINEWVQRRRDAEYLAKFQPWILLLIVLLLSLMIYFISK